jgi:hypothetical protein
MRKKHRSIISCYLVQNHPAPNYFKDIPSNDQKHTVGDLPPIPGGLDPPTTLFAKAPGPVALSHLQPDNDT